MADFGGPLAAGLQIFNQGHVGAGAADVERQDVLDAGIAAHPDGAGDAAGRTRHQDADRMLFGLFRAHQAAIRPEQRQLARHAFLGQTVAQV